MKVIVVACLAIVLGACDSSDGGSNVDGGGDGAVSADARPVDAGTSDGALGCQGQGTVHGSATAMDSLCGASGDCTGDLYVGLFHQDPATNPTLMPIAQGRPVTDVDLGAGAQTIEVDPSPCGHLFLSAFLDANENATPSSPGPGSGDLVPIVSVPVDVPTEGGSVDANELVLNFRIP